MRCKISPVIQGTVLCLRRICPRGDILAIYPNIYKNTLPLYHIPAPLSGPPPATDNSAPQDISASGARSLTSICIRFGIQCRVVRLPRWLRAKAESIILVVIFLYVRVFVCARILMAATDSECMIVSSGLSCASCHARAACMAWSSVRVTCVWSGSLPKDFDVPPPQNRPRQIFDPGWHWHLCSCLLLPSVCLGKRFWPKPQWMTPLFFSFCLCSIMMVSGRSRYGAVSLAPGEWTAFMVQLLLVCTLDVIWTRPGFVAVLNMYLAVYPLMSWIIGGCRLLYWWRQRGQ